MSVMVTTVALAAVLAGAWLAGIDRESASQARLLPDQVMTVLAEPKPLSGFALTDDRNRAFGPERLKGKWSFLFFGFTYCPDVCPTTLATLARTRDEIAKNALGADDVQFVFVSVDPNRDTASGLRQYVRAFDPSFVGVTGDDAQLARLAGQLGAVYRVEITPGVENYPVSHSAAVYLLDPRARHHAVFTPPLDAETISRRFNVVRKLAGGGAA
jgi:protein SCO1/2